MQAQHLPEFHGAALHLAQRLGNPRRVTDHVLALPELLRGPVAQQPGCLLTNHRNADTAYQPAHSHEAAECRGSEIFAGHWKYRISGREARSSLLLNRCSRKPREHGLCNVVYRQTAVQSSMLLEYGAK